MNSIETQKTEISPEEKLTEIEREISVEIEKKIIEKYAPLLMIKGASKIEAQTEWIKLHALKYRQIFNSEKDTILNMYKVDPDAAIDYIERQLETATV